MHAQGKPPINEGEEYDVLIESVGGKGDGIARVKGFVVFIPDTKEGDQVRIRVTKVLAKVGFGERIGEASAPVEKEERPKAMAPPKKEEGEIVKDEETGKEKIKSESGLEAEYDPSKESEDFGEE